MPPLPRLPTFREVQITLVAAALLFACGEDERRDTMDTRSDVDPQTLDTTADTDADGADTTSSDASDGGADTDTIVMWCSFDCWPELSCADGVVTASPGGFWSGPCDQSPSSCPSPSQTYTCEAGCGLTTRCDEREYCADSASCDMRSHCAEGQAGRVGSPCASDEDCAWPCAPFGDPPERYMRCDTGVESPVCIATDPPTMPDDFGVSCDLHPWDLASAYPETAHDRGLLLDQAGCASSLCVVGRSDACTYQACTVSCDDDGQCPPDWLCEPVYHVPGPGTTQVCSPQTLFSPGSDLPCYHR